MPPIPLARRARTHPWRAVGMTLAFVLATASCTDARLDESSSGAVTSTTGATAFAGGDTATIDPAGSATGPVAAGDSPLNGMRGAAPGIRITEDFRERVLAVDPSVTDLTGAAEGYDIVMVLAISAESARSDAPGRIADNVVATTRAGRTCINFPRCRALALTNADADYDGVSGNIEMLDNGDPGEAGFGILEYDGTAALRSIDQVTVQSKPLADRPLGPDPIFGPPGDGVLQIGTLLPVQGPDPSGAAAALAGARLATDEINDAGGVLGVPMVLVPDESGDGSPSATDAAVGRLLEQRVDAVIGGTTYAITSAALPRLTDAGVVLFSPTDTARALSIASDRGLFFRVAPPTDLEGQVLGNLISNDGYTRVAIAAGTGGDDLELAADVAAAINAASGTVTATVAVDDGADAAAVTRELIDSDPQAIVLVTPVRATAAIISAMVVQGKSPATIATYGTAANMVPQLTEAVGSGG